MIKETISWFESLNINSGKVAENLQQSNTVIKTDRRNCGISNNNQFRRQQSLPNKSRKICKRSNSNNESRSVFYRSLSEIKFVEESDKTEQEIGCQSYVSSVIEKLSKTNLENTEQRAENEDDFGLFPFDENNTDNFVVEAYNQEDNELVLTYIEIKKKSIKLTNELSLNDNFRELISGSDLVFHQNEESIEMINNVDQIDIRRSIATDDSGIDVEKDLELEDCDRKGNVIDTNGNVRIQRLPETLQETNDPKPEKSRLAYIIEELIQTEKQYIFGLDKIVYDYKKYLEENLPVNLIEKSSYIFGNINLIYEESKKFYSALKHCENIEDIADLFINSVSMFHLYPKYSKNKPTSDVCIKEFEQLIKKRQRELGDRLDLASYLLTPIQRLGKYILILEKIDKEQRKNSRICSNIPLAVEIIKNVMKKGNDFIAIDSIKCCPINLMDHGSFIIREKFHIIKPKKIEAMLFLFKDIVVITQNSLKNIEEFSYIESIEMTDLSIATFETEPLIFHLVNYPKCKKGFVDRYTFVLEAKSPKIKSLWIEYIENILWQQLDKARRNLKQLHNGKGQPHSSIDLSNRRNSKKNRSKSASMYY